MADERKLNSKAELFRRESIDAATTKMGAPLRPLGLSSWLVLIFIICMFVAVIVFLSVSRFDRKETVYGSMQPGTGTVRVTPSTQGILAEVLVKEGDLVQEGQPLMAISMERTFLSSDQEVNKFTTTYKDAANKELEALESQTNARISYAEQGILEVRAKILALNSEVRSLNNQKTIQIRRISLLEETFEAGKTLNERGLFPTIQLRQREEALLSQRQALIEINRAIDNNNLLRSQLDIEMARLRSNIDELQATLKLSESQIAQKATLQTVDSNSILIASRKGRVSALTARVGAPVQPGVSLALIVPEDVDLVAEVWVPSRAIGFIKRGDNVRVMFDAFPYQKFGSASGYVQTVSRAPVDPKDVPYPLTTNEPHYIVQVLLPSNQKDAYGSTWDIVPGSRVTADIILDQRSFLEWILDPFIAAKSNMS